MICLSSFVYLFVCKALSFSYFVICFDLQIPKNKDLSKPFADLSSFIRPAFASYRTEVGGRAGQEDISSVIQGFFVFQLSLHHSSATVYQLPPSATTQIDYHQKSSCQQHSKILLIVNSSGKSKR